MKLSNDAKEIWKNDYIHSSRYIIEKEKERLTKCEKFFQSITAKS